MFCRNIIYLISLIFLIVSSSADFPIRVLYLQSVGYSYYMNVGLDILINDPSVDGNFNQSILLDTGSSYLVLKQPTKESAFNNLNKQTNLIKTECLYLIIDTLLANFTGTPQYPIDCFATVSSSYAQIHLPTLEENSSSSSSSSSIISSQVAFKLNNRYLAGFHPYIYIYIYIYKLIMCLKRFYLFK